MRDMPTQQYEPAIAAPTESEGHRLVNPDGSTRLPTDLERQWMEEYERERDKQEKMDDPPAVFEEGAQVEQALQEYEEEAKRQVELARAHDDIESERSCSNEL